MIKLQKIPKYFRQHYFRQHYFPKISKRCRRTNLKPANDAMDALLEKAVVDIQN